MRVIFKESVVQQRTIPATAERAAFETRSQSGILVAGELRMPLSLRLDQGQAPYQAGEYQVDEECFRVDEYDRITIGKQGLKLKAITPAGTARTMAEEARRGVTA